MHPPTLTPTLPSDETATSRPVIPKPKGKLRWLIVGMLFLATVINYLDRYALSFPILLDEETRVVGIYNPKRTAPLSILIDKGGKVVNVRQGYTPGVEALIFEDVKKLLEVLHELVDQGNTVVVIEHNLDVVKTADWLIDFGPEGGDGGGEIVAMGSPEQVADNAKSWTGRYLHDLLERHRQRSKASRKKLASA